MYDPRKNSYYSFQNDDPHTWSAFVHMKINKALVNMKDTIYLSFFGTNNFT